jgi:hypothetical protein
MAWLPNVKDPMGALSAFQIAARAKSPVLNIVQVASRNAPERILDRP